jgi:hypothetical protein
MSTNRWVVVAEVGASTAATRTDSCGNMEQLELMELILVSKHPTKAAAEQAAAARKSRDDGWVYTVLSRHEYDARMLPASKTAA